MKAFSRKVINIDSRLNDRASEGDGVGCELLMQASVDIARKMEHEWTSRGAMQIGS